MQVESRKTAWKPGMPISVVIADDHQMIREGFKVLISEEKDIQIIGEASGGREAIQLAGSLSPDVMVIDISMGDTNGIEVTRQITSQNPEIKVIAYSVHADTRFIDDILKAGAAGYVLKDDAVEEVTQCIRSVISGERFFSTGIRSRMIDGFLETLTNGNTISMNVLSSREKDILKAISEGKNTKQIAALFRISSRTVDIHRKHVMDKLNMYSIAELTKFAITMGLTTTKT